MEKDTADLAPGTTALDSLRERGAALETKLAGYPGPAWRRAWLSRMLKSGLDHVAGGNARTAEYCISRAESELGSPAAGPSPAAAGTSPESRGEPNALELLRIRWREDRLRKAGEILERHGARLSSLERKAYRESIARLDKSTGASPLRTVEVRAEAGILELRRRLYGRILKAQKSRLAGRRGRRRTLVSIREIHQGPVGPYNDRDNLEGVLRLLGEADPAWLEDFLELYRGLSGLKHMIPAQPGADRK
jgi:hypothetical protein